MAKKGIKIKDIARELGVTSRVVVDRCREGGIAVQNSVTKLSVEQARSVRTWFAQTDRPDEVPPTVPPDDSPA